MAQGVKNRAGSMAMGAVLAARLSCCTGLVGMAVCAICAGGVAQAADYEVRMPVDKTVRTSALSDVGAPRSDADASKPDASKPDTAKPEGAKSDGVKPDSGKLDTGKADVPKLDLPKSETPKTPKKPVKKPKPKPADQAADQKTDQAATQAGNQTSEQHSDQMTGQAGSQTAQEAPTPAQPAPAPPKQRQPKAEQSQPAKPLTDRPEPSKPEPPRPLPVQLEPGKAETPKPKAAKQEATKAAPAPPEAAKAEPVQTVPAKPEPKPEPKIDPKAFVMPAASTIPAEPLALPTVGNWTGDMRAEFFPDHVVVHLATNGRVERVTHFNVDSPRKLALDLRGPWHKKGASVQRYDTGPIKAMVVGEHEDRLRLAIEFREGAVRSGLEPTLEIDEREVRAVIPLAR